MLKVTPLALTSTIGWLGLSVCDRKCLKIVHDLRLHHLWQNHRLETSVLGGWMLKWRVRKGLKTVAKATVNRAYVLNMYIAGVNPAKCAGRYRKNVLFGPHPSPAAFHLCHCLMCLHLLLITSGLFKTSCWAQLSRFTIQAPLLFILFWVLVGFVYRFLKKPSCFDQLQQSSVTNSRTASLGVTPEWLSVKVSQWAPDSEATSVSACEETIIISVHSWTLVCWTPPLRRF